MGFGQPPVALLRGAHHRTDIRDRGLGTAVPPGQRPEVHLQGGSQGRCASGYRESRVVSGEVRGAIEGEGAMLVLWSDGIAQCRACGRIWRMHDENDTACHGKPSCEVGWRIPHPWDGPMTSSEEISYGVLGRGYRAEEEVKCPCCGVWVDVIPRTRYGRCTYCGLRIDASKAEKRGELRGKEDE